ncbi:MAG: bifunctional GNAT family N-acetyltransferase/(deoxy)nucleoside triphosphate pyrophosphohydrolase [Acetobacteraceae bacterium]|nr:bifunctional GNAT family N-acetyltransferase/(deoxy)nucleoside triphosphate pyrophosphohydrolase [Acetobacteraceae bacterium]MDW8398623.1 bifunctional GNAT family N-acetyltransferase/(deoxy)nucleoside triphosphate pyrophosphohydrolase [Acetobacteraceae bacterium]
MPDAAERFAPLDAGGVLLRVLRAEDAPALHRLLNDWDVAKNLSRVPFPYPRDLAEEWIGTTRRLLEEGRAYHLAIEREGVLIGGIGLTIEEGGDAELGYWIGRPYRRQGAALAAARRLSRWALATLPIRAVTAAALADNAASRAVLLRAGFRETGQGERHFESRGRAMPVVEFALTREALAAEAPPPAAEAPAGGLPLVIVAACALIDPDGRVLLARRPEGKPLAGLWEFPGGKLRPGETPEAALIRELAEELGIAVEAPCLAPFAFASHGYGAFHLLMPLYLCRRWEGVVTPREGQALAWVRANKLAEYPMPPADKPLVALLRDIL